MKRDQNLLPALKILFTEKILGGFWLCTIQYMNDAFGKEQGNSASDENVKQLSFDKLS